MCRFKREIKHSLAFLASPTPFPVYARHAGEKIDYGSVIQANVQLEALVHITYWREKAGETTVMGRKLHPPPPPTLITGRDCFPSHNSFYFNNKTITKNISQDVDSPSVTAQRGNCTVLAQQERRAGLCVQNSYYICATQEAITHAQFIFDFIKELKILCTYLQFFGENYSSYISRTSIFICPL